MLILITNDDGIRSDALKYLSYELKDFDLFIVAPFDEMSAVSHSLTLRDNIWVKKEIIGNATAFSVGGTPVDCVKIAVDKLLPRKPDLLISGINIGSNTGINVLYSGTVAAALEASLLGIRAIAVSIDSFNPNHLNVAAAFTANMIRKMKNLKLDQYILNINIPDKPLNDIKGIKITRQSGDRYLDAYVKTREDREKIYYRLQGVRGNPNGNLQEDETALQLGWISVSPLKPDFNLEKIPYHVLKFLEHIFFTLSTPSKF